jgi:uncharacterized protein (DUF1015 family)
LKVAQIFPFNGIRYNPQIAGDLCRTLCPPYDIISPAQQAGFLKASPYNFINIEFNPEKPEDSAEENRYTRAAANIADWLKREVLVRDEAAAIYAHLHTFKLEGRPLARWNLIGRVKLEEWERRAVRPHENIIPRAKSDRVNMLRYCQANTSEVLSMYEDPHKIVPAILNRYSSVPPVIDLQDYAGEGHQVWAISREDDLQQIQKLVEAQPLYIADGHHRYDSALTVGRELLARTADASGLEGFNYVMMALMDFKDPGLQILPTHRLLRGLEQTKLSLLKSKLLAYFEIQSLDAAAPDVWESASSILAGEKSGKPAAGLVLFGLEPDKLSVLTVRDQAAVERVIAGTHSQLYKRLDVSLVDHVILDSLLSFIRDRDPEALIYTHDREDAIRRVKQREYQLAFILGKVKPETIKGIADAADRMPRKSTYFYPKSPAGLVFYKW